MAGSSRGRRGASIAAREAFQASATALEAAARFSSVRGDEYLGAATALARRLGRSAKGAGHCSAISTACAAEPCDATSQLARPRRRRPTDRAGVCARRYRSVRLRRRARVARQSARLRQRGSVGAARSGQRRAVAVRPRMRAASGDRAVQSTMRCSTSARASRLDEQLSRRSSRPSRRRDRMRLRRPPGRRSAVDAIAVMRPMWSRRSQRRCEVMLRRCAARIANRTELCETVATASRDRSDSMLFASESAARIGQPPRLGRRALRRRPSHDRGAGRRVVRRSRA